MSASAAAYRIQGLHCAEEARQLRAALEGRPGVAAVQIDLVKEKLVVQVADDGMSPEDITRVVAATGMRAIPWAEATGSDARTRRTAALAATSGALVAGAIVTETVWTSAPDVALIAVYAVAAAIGLWRVVPAAWRALAAMRLDMNVLVLISISGAVALGEWSEGATVASLFSAAGALEAWSTGRARRAVSALMRLAPSDAMVIEAGAERRIPVQHVHPGTIVLVRPGERVPVDGTIVNGSSTLDQSALTGEAVPVARRAGETVLAGSINGYGALEVRADVHAGDTALATMLRSVESARLRRSRTEAWIDRFSAAYTPVVLGFAVLLAVVPPLLGAGTWTEWFYRALVTTLVSCPCAMVISTPVTLVAAMASAARVGVLVKGGDVLERLAQIRVVAFDKTGVLTSGEPEVASIEARHLPADELLARLAAVEARSEHPLARAIVRYAGARGVDYEGAADVQALPGRGAEGVVAGQSLWVGSRRLAQDHHATDAWLLARADALERDGLSVVLCGHEQEVWGILGIRDRVRADAREAVQALQALGVRRTVLLTGDHRLAGDSVASDLGIDEVRAGLLPADKAQAVVDSQAQHGPIAMVGDGVNDAAALAAASVGFTIGSQCTDAALEVAGVVALRDDLRQVPWAVRHARRALGVVKQNVVAAIGAKVVVAILAAFGEASLWMAVAADTGATIAVTLNGLRMLQVKGRPEGGAHHHHHSHQHHHHGHGHHHDGRAHADAPHTEH